MPQNNFKVLTHAFGSGKTGCRLPEQIFSKTVMK